MEFNPQNSFEILLLALILACISSSFALPLDKAETEVEGVLNEGKERRVPRQVNFQQRPDGTIVGSMAFANAVDAPGFDNSFAVSNSFEIGPKGFSSSTASAFDSDIGGNKMSFANSQAQNSRQDPFGGGMSAANAAASSFSNPLFSGSNANANAFNSQFGGMPSFGK